jgi:hypothetical protein
MRTTSKAMTEVCFNNINCSKNITISRLAYSTSFERTPIVQQSKRMHPVGFEPTSTNTFELESNPLDRSGTDAFCSLKSTFDYIITLQR